MFNIMIEWALSDVQAVWTAEGKGFHIEEFHVTHLNWANNIYQLAKSTEEFATMVTELTSALTGFGFR